jgi:hypothetical protein
MTNKEKLSIWEERMASYEESGMRIGEWCTSVGCTYSQFEYWREKVNRLGRHIRIAGVTQSNPMCHGNAEYAGGGMTWFAVCDDESPVHSSMAIQVGDARITVEAGFDPVLLREVVGALS